MFGGGDVYRGWVFFRKREDRKGILGSGDVLKKGRKRVDF